MKRERPKRVRPLPRSLRRLRVLLRTQLAKRPRRRKSGTNPSGNEHSTAEFPESCGPNDSSTAILAHAAKLLLLARRALTHFRSIERGICLLGEALQWRVQLQQPVEDGSAVEIAEVAMARVRAGDTSKWSHSEVLLRLVIAVDRAWFSLYYFTCTSAPWALSANRAGAYVDQEGVPPPLEFFRQALEATWSAPWLRGSAPNVLARLHIAKWTLSSFNCTNCS